MLLVQVEQKLDYLASLILENRQQLKLEKSRELLRDASLNAIIMHS